jgi:hypothetical protein
VVDAIWAMANLRTLVDEDWLTLGPEVEIRGERVRPIPAEELIWSKLYVLQRDRSDWPDVFNLIDALAPRLDWDRLIARMGPDLPLLAAALSVFAWLAPARAARIPQEVWGAVGTRPPEPAPERQVSRARADLLDSRPWRPDPDAPPRPSAGAPRLRPGPDPAGHEADLVRRAGGLRQGRRPGLGRARLRALP